MKKILSYITISIITTQILAPFGVIQNTFAVTDSYDFDNDSVYTISDSSKAYIHGWSAKLKWSLAHRWHLENGPVAMDQPTRVIIEWNYAYVTGYGSHAVTSIDISDPTNMSGAWYIGANGTRRLYGAYDLVKSWNFIYAVSFIWDAVEIIDATDPTDLKHRWRMTNITAVKLNGARGIDVSGNFAYIASYEDDAIQILDVSNPWAPVGRWFLQDSTNLNWVTDVKVSGNYAYLTSYLSDRMTVVDISDPDAPLFIATIVDDATRELDGAWRLDVEWNYAYVASYIDDGLSVIDISNPAVPVEVWSIQNSDPWVFLNGARDVTVEWNLAYVAAYADDSLEIVDISIPSNPTHVWRLDTNSVNGRFDSANSVAVSGTDVFVVSYANSTLQSIDASNPAAPVFQDELLSGPTRLWNPVGIEVDGDYAYIATYGSSSLEIVDISNSSTPTHAWSISDNSSANELWGSWDVAKKWDYVYVSAYGDRWLETIDVSNPFNPVSTSKIIDSAAVELQNPRGSYIQWDYLYIVSYFGDSIQIFDISTPATPVARWNYKNSTILKTPNDVVVKWNYAFISDYAGDKVVVIDVTDPDAPSYVTQIVDAAGLELNGAWDLRVDGDFLYVATYIDNAIVVIDISDPTNPVYRWDLDDDSTFRLSRPRGLVFDEWYAYLTTYSNDSLVAFDVSDPDDPIFIDEIFNSDLYDTSTAVDKQDNDLFFTQYLGSSLSVVRESYPSDSPYIIPDNPVSSNYFNALNLTLGTYNEWNVTFQLSKDNGVTWYYYNGSSWVTTTGWTAQSNDVATINTNIAWFNSLPGTDQIKWKAFLNSNGTQKVEIDKIEIDYFDNTPPIIDDSFPKENDLLPKHNFDITFDYFDVDGAYGSGSVTENNGWVWIDTSDWDIDFSNNIAPSASITATVATTWWVPPHPESIVNWVISTSGAYDYEYHSNTPNAFIEFEWPTSQKVWDMKIYNRTTCCWERLTNATIKLYDDSNTLLYTHTLGSTSWISVIDINFKALWEVHNVSKLRLDSVGANSYINIREIEIFPIKENLELYKWDGTTWWDDIAHTYIDFWNKVFWTGSASYPTLDIPYGKYRADFDVSDLNGNTTSTGVIFYVDEPEFMISTGSIDIGYVDHLNNAFSDEVMVTVKTVWAWFDVTMNTPIPELDYIWEKIWAWNWTTWFWFDTPPYSSLLTLIWSNQNIWSESKSINIDGNKNTYEYKIKLWALVDSLQVWWDYEWKIDFWINLDY